MPTEREAVERERAAFARGVRAGLGPEGRLYFKGPASRTPEEAAAIRYHFPVVTRPRVVRDPEDEECHEPMWWFVRGGKILAFYAKDEADARHYLTFERHGAELSAHPTLARVALWADLFERPTEEVVE